MSEQFQFSAHAQWTIGARGIITGDEINKAIEFSAPPEFRGEPGFWTPEHMLLAAVASCFITTYRAIAGFSKFEALALEVSTEGKVEKTPGGYEFTAIVIKPRLMIGQESDRPRASRILEKTEKACLVARSLKCAVTMEASVELPQLQVQT